VRRTGVRTPSSASVTKLEPRSQRPSYTRLQGVGRTFAMLEALAVRPQTATELAEELGLSWTTLYRGLASLVELGYVERHGDQYAIGMRLYALGSTYLPKLALNRAARPYLHAASTLTGSVAQLIQRDERRSVVLSAFESRADRVPETSVGNNFPLHCGSKGHVLLTYAQDDFLEEYLSRPLERLTPETITDPDVLRHRLETVREQGYAITDRDVRVFSSSVAAPVFDRAGTTIASVTLVVPPQELREQCQRLVGLVKQTAAGVTRSLRTEAVRQAQG
jgi:DNA-binding IclR family transcriptional regulator